VGSKTTLRLASEAYLKALMRSSVKQAETSEAVAALHKLQSQVNSIPLVVWAETAQDILVKLTALLKSKPPLLYVAPRVRHAVHRVYRRLQVRVALFANDTDPLRPSPPSPPAPPTTGAPSSLLPSALYALRRHVERSRPLEEGSLNTDNSGLRKGRC